MHSDTFRSLGLMRTVLALACLPACASATSAALAPDAADAAGFADAAAPAVDVAAASGVIGSCSYTNPFSKGPECKGYPAGKGWTPDGATGDCQNAMGGPGTFTAGSDCSLASSLGSCAVAKDGAPPYVIVSGGSDPAQCATAKLGCETFAGGTFTPAAPCVTGATDPTPTTTGGGYGSVPFIQPYTICKDPLPGEPAGASPGGQVCTHVMISGCTEAGRHYEDYGKCADVLTQRPYWAGAPAKTSDANDPRLQDPQFMADLAWSKQQLEASACVCCHTQKSAPNHQPSGWYTDMDGIWLDGVADSGLAMLVGLADSTQLGAYPAADNNGFDRTTLGIPTTDIARMQKFLLKEWARRGKTLADGKAIAPFGGPLVTEATYQPTACGPGEGVDAQGHVNWLGGDARYVYILQADSANPGVPPNLDVPAKTVWLVDVPSTAAAVASGIAYGAVVGDLVQRVPAGGAAPKLVAGQTYYLYVLLDIGFPASRCTFVAP